MRRTSLLVALALVTSACAGGSASGNYVRTGAPSTNAQANPAPAPRAPTMMRGPGVDGIIGQSAASIVRRFGTARIDMAEGSARKLQFASESCVLDIYLYPAQANGAPVATHVATRQRQGGGEIDHARCIADVETVASPG
ncbi:hypothetical protein [Erythrobacter sp. KY5]|uniref:hypothetical protein n=1 Tax=Erythrobacter sp. KY5 TaxID=2011159 RepID=UPI0013A70B3B|nr:hypothetical protein [Erythrobacter sp. KY5]